MHYHILLTETCNSQCRYCYEKSLKEFDNGLAGKFKFDFNSPERFSPCVEKLKSFIDKDKDAVIVFYGGEPLLEIKKIKEIIDNINVPFRMQTNGKLLNELPIEYAKKIGKMLVSIDGTRERTDFNKGNGTYNIMTENVKNLRKKGYEGEIVARMTISDFPDVYEQVLHLLETGLFDSIHWQLDAGFFKFDFNKKKFEKFAEEYNKSISELIEYWVNAMKGGCVIKLYPFIGIMDSLLKHEKTGLRCGAGHSGYAITTSGKIVACPIMNNIEDFQAGSLDSDPRNLKKFDVSGACLKCEVKDKCGGRCLYANKAELWPERGQELVCRTVKHLIAELERIKPDVDKLISEGKIKTSDFNYEKFFGPEIIP
jgi:putative peptide-modifying radical SAM enzyme